MIREAVPDSRMTYRLGYFTMSAVYATVTAMVPATCFYKTCTQTYADFGICDCAISKIMLLLMYLVVISSFYVLQGSDPGYIVLDDPPEISDAYDSDTEMADLRRPTKPDDRKSSDGIQHGKYETLLMKDSVERFYISSDEIEPIKPESTTKTSAFLHGGQKRLKKVTGYDECYDAQIRCSNNIEVADCGEEVSLLQSFSHTILSPTNRGIPNVCNSSSPVNVSDKERSRPNVEDEFKPGGPEGPLHNRNANRNIRNHGRRKLKSTSGDGETHINDGSLYELHCKYCDISVPLRSHHCNACQRCVATFDHHCHVIGTCIGERNHCRFYAFIIFNFLGIWILSYISDSAFSSVDATDADKQLHYPPPHKPDLAYITSAVLGITWWYILLLFLYHTWLVCTGSTGYECIKSTSSSGNPQSQSDACDAPYSGLQVFDNVFSFCCIRDGVISFLSRSSWRPFIWRKPTSRPRLEDTDCQDNYCRNRHYSCC